MLQHAASGQLKESVQEGAQSHSNDQAQDTQLPSGLMRKSELFAVLHFMSQKSSPLLDHSRFLFLYSRLIPTLEEILLSNHRGKDVEIMRNVFKDRKACDTIFVCHLMSPVWGEFQEDDIARVIQARGVCKFDDDYRSLQVSIIVNLMKTGGSEHFGGGDKEIVGAKSQWKKWLKVEEQISSRGGEKDRNDKDENAAWNIWSDAKAKLEQLKELDKKPLEADDGKLTSRRGSLPTWDTSL